MTPAEILTALRDIHTHTGTARDVLDSAPGSDYARAEHVGRIAAEIAQTAATIAGGEYRPAYNGHRNRETWNASLWISNEEPCYLAAQDVIRRAMAGADWDSRGTYDRDQNRRYLVQVAAAALRDWWDETFGPTRPGPVVDAWSYALDVADWSAIVDGLVEGMDPAPWKGFHE